MDISKFLDRFNENYNFLYDNSDRVAGYYEALDYETEAQQIESGQFYRYVYDLFGVYGGMNK